VVKMVYTEEEKCEIIYLFYKNNKNAVAARTEYRNLHPDRPLPSRSTFYYVKRNFRQRKNVQRKKRTVQINENEELEILLYFEGKY